MSDDDDTSHDQIKENSDMQAVQAVQNEISQWNACLEIIARQKDRNSFRELFDHFAPLIKSFALRSGSSGFNESFAEEIVQETMLKVWIKAASFDASRANASTWIFTIARNTRIDLLRKNSRHDKNVDQGDALIDSLDSQYLWPDEYTNDVFNQLALERNRIVIQNSMKDLPPEQSLVLKQVFLEDKTHQEVAQELGLPLGTVKSRVRLALKKLNISIDR